MASQDEPELGFGEADFPHAQEGPGQIESRPGQGLGIDLPLHPVLQARQGRLVDGVGPGMIPLVPFTVGLLPQVGVGRRGGRIERIDSFQVEDVGEVLDRHVEDVGQEAQLVEGGVALAALVT